MKCPILLQDLCKSLTKKPMKTNLLKHIPKTLLKITNSLIDEYEQTRNKYYKRVKHFEDSGENSSVMRLTLLDNISEDKRL